MWSALFGGSPRRHFSSSFPDVFLSYLAIDKGWKTIAKAVLSTLVGALLGGGIMYLWARQDPSGARSFLDLVPLVTPEMIAAVKQNLEAQGLTGMVIAALTGVPYKIFAVQAATIPMPLSEFLLLSVPARLFRWLLVVLVAHQVAGFLRRYWSRNSLCLVLIAFWLLFYLLFFLVMSE